MGNIDLWIQYKRCKAKIKYAICTAKSESWKEFVSSLNKDTLFTVVWSIIKMLKNKNTSKSITLKDPSGTFISDPIQVANKLAEDFPIEEI